MCGLAGSWEPRGERDSDALERIVRGMARLVESRGPDDSGEWADPDTGVALGHRRLAIVDLSPRGRQPMVSADGNLVIAYNGEIYNFRELRAELEAAGASFRGDSDTEVLLEACAAWGIERAVGRCIGMFAFALWERSSRRLHLARDRLGIKPLYWARIPRGLLFASQPKCFSVHPEWRPAIDRAAFAEYLRHGYVNAPRCTYQDAFQVRPGHILTLDVRGEPREHCYWNAAEVARCGIERRDRPGEVEAVETLDALLRDAVARRMVADVPLGAFLSGGIDSSTVVALMQAQSSRPVRTFSIGFDEKRYGGLEGDVDRMQLLDMLTYLPSDILTKVDRASMAFPLEARVPLLDHRVVEHAWSLPADLKVRSGETKWILRRVL